MDQQQKIQRELWRADVYKLLTLGFDTPSEANFKVLSAIAEDLSSIDSLLLPTFLGQENGAVYSLIQRLIKSYELKKDSLEDEYNRLFVTKSECPASEGSYHLAERGPILGDVCAFYEAFQIRIKPESGPHDSMKMELGFMYYLALKKVHALERGLTEAHAVTEDAEKKFLNAHLGRWTERFVARLNEATSHTFYRLLGAILNEWIQEECRRYQISPALLPTALLDEGEGCFGCAL